MARPVRPPVSGLPELLGALPSPGRVARRRRALNCSQRLRETRMRYRQTMGNAMDVLTFLAAAAALGLGVGTVLGVLALVLAAPAHAGPAAAGSLLLHRQA